MTESCACALLDLLGLCSARCLPYLRPDADTAMTPKTLTPHAGFIPHGFVAQNSTSCIAPSIVTQNSIEFALVFYSAKHMSSAFQIAVMLHVHP